MKEAHTRYYDVQDGSFFLNFVTDDILLGLMMAEATVSPVEKKLYLPKSAERAHRQEWLSILGYSLSTYRRHFSDLRDVRLVIDEGANLIFPQHFPKYFIGLDTEKIKKVCGLGLPHALKVYALVDYWSRTKGDKRFVFTSKFIGSMMGYSEGSNKHLKIIEEILTALRDLGLIDYHEEYEVIESGEMTIPRPVKILH